MICRTQLVALDHNAGANLDQAKTIAGNLRYNLVFPKQSARWTVKPITKTNNMCMKWFKELFNAATITLY